MRVGQTRRYTIFKVVILIAVLYIFFMTVSHFTHLNKLPASTTVVDMQDESSSLPNIELYTKKKVEPGERTDPLQHALQQKQQQQQDSTVTTPSLLTGKESYERRGNTKEQRVDYVIVTVSRDQVNKYFSIIPCLRKRYEKHIILTFGLSLPQEQIDQIEDLRDVHFVAIPVGKFSSDLQTDGTFDRAVWSNVVKKLGKRFSDSFANGDRIYVDDLAQDCQISSFDVKYDELEQKKFGVVVPFINVQVDNLIEQFRRWAKPKYAACNSDTNVRHKYDLVLYYHKQFNQTLQDLLLSELSHNVLTCFDKIIFRYAQLLPDEDVYPIAANYMFYRLIHDVKFHTTYRYMFYSEPDAWALRPNWLEKLEKVSYGHPEQFWVKGSIYRGPRRDLGRLSVNIHVNGNAIYSLIDDYLLFLYRVQSSMPTDSYDVAQTRLLFRDPGSLRAFWHRFVFSEFIQNLWQVEWSENQIRRDHPECFFVHGKSKLKEGSK